MEELARPAMDAALKGEHDTLCKISSTISGRQSTTSDVSVTYKHGKNITLKNEQEERWAEHVEQPLNGKPTSNTETT